MNNCLECETETSNPKFCSRSCSASYNNRLGVSPKRSVEQQNMCRVCGKYVRRVPSQLCMTCWGVSKAVECGRKRLGDVLIDGRARHIYQEVRNHAHKVMKYRNLPKQCWFCGYTVYVELCHIKSISDFNRDDTLEQINGIDNLVYLCPNHHKELDLGFLVISPKVRQVTEGVDFYQRYLNASLA